MKRINFAVLYVILLISLLVALIGSFILAGCGTNPTGGGGGGGGGMGHPWIYVSNTTDKTISVIDGATNTAIGSIDASSGLSVTPYHMAATSDGKKIYCRTSTTDIAIINTDLNTVEGFIDATTAGAGDSADRMVITPGDNFLYFGSYSNSALYRVYLKGSNTLETVTIFSDPPSALVLNDAGTKAYINTGGASGGTIEVVTLSNSSVQSLTYLGDSKWAENIALKGNRFYAPIYNSGDVEIFDATTGDLLSTISCSADDLRGIVVIPGKNKIYVANFVDTGSIEVINSTSSTDEFTATVISSTEMALPNAMAVLANGEYVYVRAYEDPGQLNVNIALINTNTDNIEKLIPIGRGDWWDTCPLIIYK